MLLADHSYNASTFSARVTASTGADIYCSITAAVATLAGDLHGGAPSKVMTMLEEIGLPEKAEPYVRELLARHEKIMGMGHREYKIRDPRAAQLEKMAKNLTEKSHTKWYLIARALEDASQEGAARREARQADLRQRRVLHGADAVELGIPSDEFTCLFACGRISGWSAHVLEQFAHNRLIRPQATYVGPEVHPYEPIGQRHAQPGTQRQRRGDPLDGWRDAMERARARSRARRRRRASTCGSRSTAARSRSRPTSTSSTTCSARSRRTAGSGCELVAHGDGMDHHHLVEDVGIALGRAVDEALGDKRGIARFGSIAVPLDDALVQCAVDLSGRPWLNYDVPLSVPSTGRAADRARSALLSQRRRSRQVQPAPAALGRDEQPPPLRGDFQSVRARVRSGQSRHRVRSRSRRPKAR